MPRNPSAIAMFLPNHNQEVSEALDRQPNQSAVAEQNTSSHALPRAALVLAAQTKN